MSDTTLKSRINDEMKAAMRAKDKPRLGAIRLIQAEIKRIEVDERIDVDNDRLLIVLDKMCKQRRDSIQQYLDASRQELADQEQLELDIIQEFLPSQLTEAELDELIGKAISDCGAQGMQEMGKVMGILKPQVQGRADMSEVSRLIKARLG